MARRIAVTLLGIVYLLAFASLAVQVTGLWGARGILPASGFLAAVAAQVPPGLRHFAFPTVFWFNSSDAALVIVCSLGAVAGLVIASGYRPRLFLSVAWALYLSLFTIGRDFLHFQWDLLLLEAGFLAIFWAPGGSSLKTGAPPSRVLTWLFRWLVFRLFFSSGAVKLLSGDTAWKSLTALRYHYETQPLPPWTAWHAHHLPPEFHAFSTAATLVVELAVPFLIFFGRRGRLAAFACFAWLQALILLTGNYGFFNLLTLALLFSLLETPGKPARGTKPAVWALAGFLILSSGYQMAQRFSPTPLRIRPIEAVCSVATPFCWTSPYGLFAVMTVERPEILVEGSLDGKEWRPYEFRWKPGDPAARPRFVAPHQPRLDWQMWFAALGDWRRNRWFVSFCARLMEGSPEVLRLLKRDPFEGQTPKFIRASLYDYHFSSPAQRKTEGVWWTRTDKGLYAPIFRRED